MHELQGALAGRAGYGQMFLELFGKGLDDLLYPIT